MSDTPHLTIGQNENLVTLNWTMNRAMGQFAFSPSQSREIANEILSIADRIAPAVTPSLDLKKVIEALTLEIYSQREEIIRAFIAKFQCQPEDIIQCNTKDGRWFLRKMTPEEIEFRDLVAQKANPIVYGAGNVRAFATAILHGSEAHREWLLAAAEAFLASKPLPEPKS